MSQTDSFQSSPGQKAGCNRGAMLCPALRKVFQSSPGQKAGCNENTRRHNAVMASFNPHPARRPDAMRDLPVDAVPHPVSILTRPEGRMQCPDHVDAVLHEIVSILTRPEGRMQYVQRRGDQRLDQRFNPHPARRPDAMRDLPVDAVPHPVSILTRPEGRMQCPDHVDAVLHEIVSILTRPEGRMQYVQRRGDQRLDQRFNPHPARRPDAI